MLTTIADEWWNYGHFLLRTLLHFPKFLQSICNLKDKEYNTANEAVTLLGSSWTVPPAEGDFLASCCWSEPVKTFLCSLSGIGLRNQTCDQPRPIRPKGKPNGGELSPSKVSRDMSGRISFSRHRHIFRRCPKFEIEERKMEIQRSRSRVGYILPGSPPISSLRTIGDKISFLSWLFCCLQLRVAASVYA